MFQEMGTTPTTFEATRYADLLSMARENTEEGRDVTQPYLQAEMEARLHMLRCQESSVPQRCIRCDVRC